MLPAVIVAGAAALAGCAAKAPGVAAVTAPATQVPQTQPSGSTAAEPSGDAAPSIPTVPPTSEPAPETSTKTPGECFDSATMGHPAVTSETSEHSYGDTATASDSGDDLSITVSKGTKATGDDDAFGGPDDGDALLVFDVKAKLTSGSMSVVSYTQFTLWDPDGNACRANIFSSAVSSDDRMSLKMLSDSAPSVEGKIVFEVPEGEDYSEYTMSWASVSSSSHAAVSWKG